MCGGTIIDSTQGRLRQGLSPRVRGNLVRTRYEQWELRSIPACAGEPGSISFVNIPYAVYPRVCGGTSHDERKAHRDSGLSPRVRGNPHPSSLDDAR